MPIDRVDDGDQQRAADRQPQRGRGSGVVIASQKPAQPPAKALTDDRGQRQQHQQAQPQHRRRRGPSPDAAAEPAASAGSAGRATGRRADRARRSRRVEPVMLTRRALDLGDDAVVRVEELLVDRRSSRRGLGDRRQLLRPSGTGSLGSFAPWTVPGSTPCDRPGGSPCWRRSSGRRRSRRRPGTPWPPAERVLVTAAGFSIRIDSFGHDVVQRLALLPGRDRLVLVGDQHVAGAAEERRRWRPRRWPAWLTTFLKNFVEVGLAPASSVPPSASTCV